MLGGPNPSEQRLAALPPSDVLKVLVIDSASLFEHACALVQSAEDVASVVGHEAAMSRLADGPFDIVLVTVVESALITMVTAARMRAIERRHLLPRAAIIACTSNLCDYGDCVHSGSGLSGALNTPWTRATVHACLDRWRAGKYLRELRPADQATRPAMS
jgi:hypothetical protein